MGPWATNPTVQSPEGQFCQETQILQIGKIITGRPMQGPRGSWVRIGCFTEATTHQGMFSRKTYVGIYRKPFFGEPPLIEDDRFVFCLVQKGSSNSSRVSCFPNRCDMTGFATGMIGGFARLSLQLPLR